MGWRELGNLFSGKWFVYTLRPIFFYKAMWAYEGTAGVDEKLIIKFNVIIIKNN